MKKPGTPEDPEVLKARVARDLFCPLEEKLTKDSFERECDVNVIMMRAMKTGELPAGGREGFYGDVSSIGDFQTVQNGMREARRRVVELFEKLPAGIRKEFHDDGEEFANWAGEETDVVALAHVLQGGTKVAAEKVESQAKPGVPGKPDEKVNEGSPKTGDPGNAPGSDQVK